MILRKPNWKQWFVLFLLLFGGAIPSHAQTEETTEAITFRLNRDFGYGGLNNDIQGRFSYVITDPADSLVRVEFLLDGAVIGEDSQPPFRFQFLTDNYSLGAHQLSVVGYFADGQSQQSRQLTRNFVPESESWQAGLKIAGPILGLTLGSLVLAALVSFVVEQRNPTPLGATRKYGLMGGTVCPKCQRPFAIHIWSLNAVAGKYDRCPHCRKWVIVKRLPLEQLRAAEQAEKKESAPAFSETMTAEEKLQRQLDDSRYL